MLPKPFDNALVLTGPTGSGKSELAVELAERLAAEIIAMDSMSLYRGMDIGTAKPSHALRRRVPHHLLDVLDPWQSASVAWWLEQAASCCREIEAQGKRVLFAGGTALYLKALLRGLFAGPPANPELRQRLQQDAEQTGCAALHHRLAQVDPLAAARLHPNDIRRVIRALEVWELTGKPISEWQQQGWSTDPTLSPEPPPIAASGLVPGPPTANPALWLDIPRADLYDRINLRVTEMVQHGLVDEVRRLRALPAPLSREAGQALGYKEMLDFLDGKQTLADTVEQIQTRTRNYAKRQLTWFRSLPECRPVSKELTFSAWGLTIVH
jgi:tRNA dimethylallyltransferase